MSAWSLVGLLICVRVGAVDEVPNFMKSGGPALTRRRLDVCTENCIACDGPGDEDCLECESGYILYDADGDGGGSCWPECRGQTACYADGSPCATGEFCNFDGGSSGTCEECSKFDDVADCYTDGLPSDGAFDCHSCCFGNITRFPTGAPTTAAPSTQSPTGTPTTAAPSMTFAPTSPYEYAPTENVMPYCRLQSSSVCWGNTHRFLAVTANGPFDGIDAGSFSRPALGDLDGDGTLRRCP